MFRALKESPGRFTIHSATFVKTICHFGGSRLECEYGSGKQIRCSIRLVPSSQRETANWSNARAEEHGRSCAHQGGECRALLELRQEIFGSNRIQPATTSELLGHSRENIRSQARGRSSRPARVRKVVAPGRNLGCGPGPFRRGRSTHAWVACGASHRLGKCNSYRLRSNRVRRP